MTAPAEEQTGQCALQRGGIESAALPFRAPVWLPGKHAQTIYPPLFGQRPRINFRREKWDTPDGDFVDVDFVDGQPDKPFLVLFHGMEGNSTSHYVRNIMDHIQRLGWSGAVPHFRSCSGTLNITPRLYHCGDYQEADWILRRLNDIAQNSRSRISGHKRPFYAAGASLGGSVLLHWLGQSQHAADFVDAAVSICAPLDVAAGGAAIGRGVNRIYTRAFLKTLKPKALQKLAQHPGLFDQDALLQCKTIYDFDSIVTAPLHGFRSVEDYWQCASANRILPDITVPTLVLNTQNDPFLPARYLPTQASRAVELEYPTQGGHLGFTTGPPPGNQLWLPRRMTHFFGY